MNENALKIALAGLSKLDAITTIIKGVSAMFKKPKPTTPNAEPDPAAKTGAERFKASKDMLLQVPAILDLVEDVTQKDLINDPVLDALVNDVVQTGYDLTTLYADVREKETRVKGLLAQIKALKGTGGPLQPGQ